jgi:Transposase
MEVLYPRCAGLDVHKGTVVAACVRLAEGRSIARQHRTFDTSTRGLLALSEWLSEHECSHVALEATGVYWKLVWHIRSTRSPPVLPGPGPTPPGATGRPQASNGRLAMTPCRPTVLIEDPPFSRSCWLPGTAPPLRRRTPGARARSRCLPFRYSLR